MKWLQLSGAGSGGAAAGPTNAGFWILLSPYLTPLSTSHNVLVGLNSSDLSFGSGGSIVTSASLVSVTASVNASVASLAAIAGSYVALNSYHTGSGTNLPMAFFTGGAERMRLLVAGNWLWGQTVDDGSTMAVQIKGGLSLSGNASGNYLGRIWISTDTSQGQNAGTPGVAGPGTDNTAIDNNGFEGNFFRVKSHSDYFDWTVWNPTLSSGPLAAHTLQLRDSSNQVLLNYSATGAAIPGTLGPSAGVFSFIGSVNISTTETVQWNGQAALRYNGGHVQFSDNGTTWTNLAGGSSQWTLTGSLLYPNSTTDLVLIGRTTDDGSGARLQIGTLNDATGSINAGGLIQSYVTGTHLGFQVNSGTFIVNGAGAVSCAGPLSIAGQSSTYALLSGFSTTDATFSNKGGAVFGDSVFVATAVSNASALWLGYTGSLTFVSSYRTGTGTYLPLALFTSNAEAMRIQTDSSVLIGLTSSDAFGSAAGVLVAGKSMWVVSATANASALWLGFTAGTYTFISSYATGTGTFLPLAFFTNNAEAMRIDTSQRLLVGFTSTDITTSLVASGSLVAASASANASVLSIGVVAGTYTAIGSNRSGTGTYLPLAIFVNGAERMRILTTGVVLINRTTDDGSGAQLQVSGTISSNGTVLAVP